MESLTIQQEENGKEIQRIVVNYRKDGSERKTVDYYKERLKRLDNVWNAFEAVDTEIRSLKNVDLQHEYFISNYFQEIEGIYNTYRAHFNSKLEVRIDENREEVLVQHDGHGSDVRPKFQVETSLQVTQAENEEISETIRRVVRRQNRNFQTLKRLLATVDGQQSKHYYGVKFDSIKQLWSDIEQDDRQIWESTDSPSTYGYQEHIYAEYEAQVQEALIDIGMNLEQTAVPHTVMGTNQGMHSPLKLPKVTLPKFDGDYLYWQQFRDLFSQMVHNQDIPGCQRMFYLKTNLSGEAERLIRHLTITEDNYAIAWKTLQERYNNPRLQVSALVNKLLSQQSHANDYPSAASLKTLHDTTQECLLGLQNLGVSTKGWDPLLLHWMVKKLDKTTHTLYEQSLDNPRQLQNLDDFLNFLELRFQSLEVLGSKGRIDDRYRKQGVAQALTASATDSRGNKQCILCKDKHALHVCKIFTGAKIVDRVKIINKHNLCRNCLRTGHRAVNCGSRGCTKCELKHHTLIHSDNREAMKASHPGRVTNAEPEDILSFPSTVATSTNRHEVNYVFLGTVVVKIMNSKGESVKCRALLDSGSQVNLITTKMVKCLKLIAKGDQLHIQGVRGNKAQSQARVNVLMESLLCDYSARVEAFVIGNIVPPQPAQTFDVSKWPIPKNIKLADPDFYKSEEIDLLLGAEFYHELLSIGQIKMAKDLPVLQNTIFGWIVVGKTKQASISAAVCGVCSEDENLNGIIERFWKLEEVDSSMSTLTSVEKKCESHFNQTVKRDVNGRFIVSLPFSDDPNRLGDSQEIAMRRFLSLERRLQRDRSLKEQYVQFMTEYLQRNHMEEVNTRGLKGPVYYLPHHSVLKLDSSTTKLRVVFDASAKSNSGLSLNNLLHAGPTIQDDLFSILLRFRMPRFVFTADIKQMYRQILISEEDRKYQLVFWRNDASHPIKCFQLRTVTYGTTPAPYLATKCLQKLAHDRVSSYPLGAQVLERDFYVDDVLTGSDSMSTALMMRDQLQKLLQEGCFKLHKWCSNHPQLLNGIPFEDREAQLIFEDDNPEKVKTLGLIWYPKEDEFHVKFNSKHSSAVTKRTISSDIARLFDPLGIMSPVIVAAKIFLQELWQLKLEWDAALPLEMHSSWCQFREELQEIDNLHFNRHIFAHEATHNIQLHVFADASEKAFGAVAYIRSLNKEKRTIIRLLCAKSWVAPLKRQTLPRLELCAAALATKLADRIKTNLKLVHTQIYFWTDSQIVLNWINSPAQHYQTFVANRISVIQGSSIAEQWRHVRSSENPADILSRGLTPVKLKGCNTWFYGPMFLHLSEDRWPASYQQHATCDLEKRKCYLSENVAAVNTAANQADLSRQIDNGHWLQNIDHGNSFRKLQRILAYSMRFIAHCKKPLRPSTTKLLSPKELENALAVIVRTIQQESFKTEIKQLNEKLEVHPTSALSTLNPFLDNQGIIRVGGRLKNSSLSYDAKHQMLLPYAHPITNLLMTSIHQENMHIGPQGLLAQTRQRFWPVRGKNIARSIIQHCTWCAKRKPKFLEQMMGDLPATRVQPARPFINSGVDYCGPVWIHYKGRGRKTQKAYIAVFCCFATKAIHLELVSDLTTEAFIGALRRFVGRRGHCKTIYCDNATNFVGASNQLSELIETMHSTRSQEKIVSECSKKGIEFKFIPPRAPHFGGLWEAAVKSTKLLLQKGTASASLTYEELETLLIEVEAILNSRPLTQLSNDPNDLAALTPGHFLIGEPLTNAVDTSAEPLKGSLLTRWKLVSHIKQEFWRRWSSEYLNELQQRYKWRKRVDNAKPGTIVVIKDDNAPVMKWPLGRIIQTFKDDNGLVRVAEVKTASGILKRPIHKLAPLPCEINDDSQPETEPGDQLDSTISIKRPHEHQLGDQANTSADITPKKKTRVEPKTSLAALLFTCLILPLIPAKQIEINNFEGKPGLHFEGIATTRFVTSKWNLVVYYDLQSYFSELTTFSNGIDILNRLCNQTHHEHGCEETIHHFRFVETDLKIDNELISSHQRHKRGAFNVIGNMANSLFGVLDSDYAENMSHTIKHINTNQEYLKWILKNQTSIIDSTINIMKTDQTAISQKFNAIDDNISRLTNGINTLGNDVHRLMSLQQFTILASQLTLMSARLQHIQSDLLDAMTSVHHSKISTLLLTPNQFKAEITRIKNYLPPTLQLPIIQHDIASFYSLMSIRSRMINNHIIFRIQLPLTNVEIFTIYHVIPIPVVSNSTILAIKPTSDFLAVNQHHDLFSPMTEIELTLCIKLEAEVLLCEQQKPLYRKGADAYRCELNLLNEQYYNQLEDCELAQVNQSPIWIHLNSANHWIYATKENITVTTICEDDITHTILTGAGLLKLDPECIIKHSSIIIHGHQLYNSTTRNSYTRLGDLPHRSQKAKMTITITQSRPYEDKANELEKLKEKIDVLKHFELPNDTTSTHQFAIGYTSLSLALIIIVILGYKMTKDVTRCSRKKPIPAPRTQSRDFSKNI